MKNFVIPDAFVPLRFKAKRSFAKRFDDYTVKEAIRFEGTEEGAYFISAEDDKKAVILKVSDNDEVSVMKVSGK